MNTDVFTRGLKQYGRKSARQNRQGFGSPRLKSGDPFGTYAGTAELGGVTWHISENAAAAQLGEAVCLVRGYECDFSSAEVRTILGSLRWAE